MIIGSAGVGPAGEVELFEESTFETNQGDETRGCPQVVVGHQNTVVRELFATALEKEGYRVSAVGDGGALLEVLADMLLSSEGPNIPELIIADSELEVRSGFELVADLRYIGWLVPFIITTPQGVDEQAFSGRSLTRVLVFPAPFTVEEICASAKAILGPYQTKSLQDTLRCSSKSPTISWVYSNQPAHHGHPGAEQFLFRFPPLSGLKDLRNANAHDAEERNNRRAAVRVPVGLWFEDITHSYGRGLYCMNLSTGGLFLCDAGVLHRGQVFSGFLALPRERTLVHAFCQVVNVRRSNRPVGCGVKFLNLSTENRTTISNFVRKSAEYQV